jgi:hypothetical protein
MKPQTQDTARDLTQCAICGTSGIPLVAKDIFGRTASPWRLAAICCDSRACAERRIARDRHMDERYSLTATGRAALAAAESAEVA